MYTDRARLPSETVSGLRPHFEALGITRLARQTGLDRLGIPCFAAIRPNSPTLAANQGKGITDEAAMASAAMEAAEYAVAERPSRPLRLSSAAALRQQGAAMLLPTARLPSGTGWPDTAEIAWLEGYDYFDGTPVWVPRELAALIPSPDRVVAVARSTNGLASGNNASEASFHALCELIERDAMALWGFVGPEAIARAALDPESFGDPVISGLAARIADAGLGLRLFDLTTDIGVPVIMALIEEPDARLHFDLASGVGCHPVAVRAALRAVTEAAQTRVTNVAGARDDFDPAEYSQRLDPGLRRLPRGADADRAPPAGAALGTLLADLHGFLAGRLREARIGTVAIVPLGGEPYGIAVAKVVAPELEDAAGNPYWRPGRRALRVMTRLW